MRDREWRHITNEATDEIRIGWTPISIRNSFESIVQQLCVDPFDNVGNDGYYPGDEYRRETGWAEPRLMLDIDSSGHLGATPEQEGRQEFYRVMIHDNWYIPQWKNWQDWVWNYFPDDVELGTPRRYFTYEDACVFISRFSHINVGTDVPLTSIIGRGDLPDEKVYLYYR